MSKEKIIKIVDGITITKPWNTAMYEYNDIIANEMKANIIDAIAMAYKAGDIKLVNEIQKYICSYGMGAMYSIDDVYREAVDELDRVQNFWLNDIYPDMVKDGIVKGTTKGFVGYSN
jgi:hypothetical protein